jgi:hypothetical protein
VHEPPRRSRLGSLVWPGIVAGALFGVTLGYAAGTWVVGAAVGGVLGALAGLLTDRWVARP